MHKQRNEWQTVVQKILHHIESFWRAGGASRKRPSDRPSTQRLAHAQQFGKRVITQAPALTSGIVLAEGAIALTLTLRSHGRQMAGDPLRAYGLEVFAFTRPAMRVETALLFDSS